ncbi:MAG TPA: PatB family C-S lyase, partial [Trueperaceae bacterium]|nr:PatB family C-S lyase [Trueperaceae bacterium]
MSLNFPVIPLPELQNRASSKWRVFEPDVLPLWVAEMDFPIAPVIRRAIEDHLDTNDLGYGLRSCAPGLRDTVAARLESRYGLQVDAEGVLPLSSTGAALRLAVLAFAGPGDEVLLLTPLYPPFKMAVEVTGRVPVQVELVDDGDGYTIDFAALQAAVTPATRLLMLCNPHNPVGRVFTKGEVEELADFALRNNLWVVSDDLHADLIFDGRHQSIAALGGDIADRTVTLYGPSKAFNIPGLDVSFAVASNPAMLERLSKSGFGLTGGPNRLAQAATMAAYQRGDSWLAETLAYLRTNRDTVVEFVKSQVPGVGIHSPQGTYLAWLDLRRTGLGELPAKELAARAKIGLNEGSDFGAGGAGFARLNFATSAEVLQLGLERLRAAL